MKAAGELSADDVMEHAEQDDDDEVTCQEHVEQINKRISSIGAEDTVAVDIDYGTYAPNVRLDRTWALSELDLGV